VEIRFSGFIWIRYLTNDVHVKLIFLLFYIDFGPWIIYLVVKRQLLPLPYYLPFTGMLTLFRPQLQGVYDALRSQKRPF